MDGERGGSSLHCSRWIPNVIYKGASHYLACICLTHTSPVNQYTILHTQAKPERTAPSTWMRDMAVPFTVCGIVSTWRPTVQLYSFSGNRSSNLPRNCKVTLGVKFICVRLVCRCELRAILRLEKKNTRFFVFIDRRYSFLCFNGEKYRCSRDNERER